MYPHNASCYVWVRQDTLAARCDHPRPYRIRKVTWSAKPWVVWHRRPALAYRVVARVASFEEALEAVSSPVSEATRG